MIEAYRIKKFLYDPGDGKLIWIKDSRNQVKLGYLAGSINKSGGYSDQWRWRIMLLGRDYYRSRLVFALHNDRWPLEGMRIDHIDTDTLNDCITNLKEVTQDIHRVYKSHPSRHLKFK